MAPRGSMVACMAPALDMASCSWTWASGGGAQGRGDASNGHQRIVSGLSLYGSRRLPKGMGQFSIVIRWPLGNDRGVFS